MFCCCKAKSNILKSPFGPFDVSEVPAHQLVLQAISKHGNKIALIESSTGSELNYLDVYGMSHAIATSLHNRGIKKGDIVAVMLHNTPFFIISYLGLALRGAVMAVINPKLTDKEITSQIMKCSTKFVITNYEYLPKLRASLFNSNWSLESTESIIQEVFVVQQGEKLKSLALGATTFETILATKPNYDLPKVQFDCKTDIALLQSSSGKTEHRKMAMATHFNITAALQLYYKREIFAMPEPGEHMLTLMPMEQHFGFLLSLWGLIEGCPLITVPHLDEEIYMKLIEKYKITHLFGRPAILKTLVNTQCAKEHDCSSIKAVTITGPIKPQIIEKLVEIYPKVTTVSQCYGMTENLGSHRMPPTELEKMEFRSCGKLLPNNECKILERQSKESLGHNEIGEICIRSPTVMAGYLNDSEATNQMIDKNGWLHTGDIGFYDKNGNLFIKGRSKDLIKVEGQQVSPIAIEGVLLSHPEIEDVAVVGKHDSVTEEAPTAYVVKRRDSNMTQHNVQDYAKERTAQHEHLKGVMFVNRIPRTPGGKIIKTLLT